MAMRYLKRYIEVQRNKYMKTKLAIFDLDGTLFDTYEVNFSSYEMALKEEGYTLDRGFYKSRCNGKHYKEYLPLIIDKPSNDLMERIHCRKKMLYPTFLSHAKENKHLLLLIQLIRSDYHIALVTTASKANCMSLLEYHNISSSFELILTQEDVTNMKPDPEGFLKTINYFGTTPEDTLIFEDSDSGIEAAKKCGASILSVLDFSN